MSIKDSVLFILIFVFPFALISITPIEVHPPIEYGIILSYLLFAFSHKQVMLDLQNSSGVKICTIYVICILIKFLVYGKASIFSAFAPFAAFMGFLYIVRNKLNIRVFEIYFVLIIVYFIFNYYMKLSTFFHRIGFDDGSWFGGASANAIPLILVNTLYIYIIINYLQKEEKKKIELVFSCIVFVLSLIQQSRIGVFVALIILMYTLFRFATMRLSRKKTWLLLLLVIPVFLLIVRENFSIVDEYISTIGGMDKESYEEDVRSEAINSFFNNLDFVKFLFGYNQGYIFAREQTYTYNMWLEHWNRYTLLGFITIIVIFLRRFRTHKLYYYPLYFFVPLLCYGYFESRFLPNYWDFFIYLMLFKYKDEYSQ